MCYDLNAAIVSMILTGLGGFSTAAGHIGPEIEVGHDISMLVPEIWCRLRPEEREPAFLIREGMLERLEDCEYNGKSIPVSRLGYRITSRFVRHYFGRVFDNPSKVFDEKILCPETQDPASFYDGVLHIAEAQQRVAKTYLEDGSLELACPPLKALLHIMAEGHWNGKTVHDPEVRAMFTREHLLASDWYRERLVAKQTVDIRLWTRHVTNLKSICQQPEYEPVIARLGLRARLQFAERELARCRDAGYVEACVGTLGVDPQLVREG
jgi:hypothetical protein